MRLYMVPFIEIHLDVSVKGIYYVKVSRTSNVPANDWTHFVLFTLAERLRWRVGTKRHSNLRSVLKNGFGRNFGISSSLHGSLFLVNHLLTLCEQMTPFEIQLAQTKGARLH